MSVISAFTYLFSADTSGVAKGLQAGDTAAKSVKNTLDKTDVVAKKLSETFTGLVKNVIALGAAALTLGTIKGITVASAEQTNALVANARALRLDTDELATWIGMIERSGGSAAEFEGTLRNLMQRTRDPLGALERVANRFKGLSDLQADKLGERLGLDKGTVQAMREGADGLQKLIRHQQSLGIVTKEQIDVAQKFRVQLQDTNTVLDDVRRRIATAVLPVLTQWLEKLQNVFMWMRDKKEFVIAFFSGVAAIVTFAFLPALLRATAASWAFLAPWLPLVLAVTAASAAIALVVDDIMAFRSGANSMIGEISKNWPVVGVIVNELCDALSLLMEIATAAFKFLADGLLRPQEAFSNFGKTVDDILSRMGEKFPYISAVFQGFSRAASAATNTVSAAFSLMWAIVRPIVEGLQAAFKIASDITSGVKGLFTGAEQPKQQTPKAAAAFTPNSVPSLAPNSPTNIPTTSGAKTQLPDAKQIPSATGSQVAPKVAPPQTPSPVVMQIPTDTGSRAPVVNVSPSPAVKVAAAAAPVVNVPPTQPAAAPVVKVAAAQPTPSRAPIVNVPPTQPAAAPVVKVAAAQPTPAPAVRVAPSVVNVPPTQPAAAPVVKVVPPQQKAAQAVVAPQQKAAQAVAEARPVVAAAAANPLSSTTSNTINNSSRRESTRTTTVQTGPITISTQATDAKGISDALGKSLQEQLKSANDEFDDGIVS